VYGAIANALLAQLQTAGTGLKAFVWKWDSNEGAPAWMEGAVQPSGARNIPVGLLRLDLRTLSLETIRFRNIESVLPQAPAVSLRPDQQRGSLKTKRVATDPDDRLKKPDWIRIKAPSSTGRFRETRDIVRTHKLVTVCEEAACPNLDECWSKGTATFMIMGDKCTRRCRFCNVSTGRPDPLDADEPQRLAETVALMKLDYVVITSVDRDDLPEGGAGHFVQCIERLRSLAPATTIEILTPDFGGRLDLALEILAAAPPDVMNHNIETVPRLYKEARPGADFQNTLNLLQRFKARHPRIPTKSGLMVGLGETDEEVLDVLRALRGHGVDMLTIGQYLQPTRGHMPVLRYVPLDVFKMYADAAYEMGFKHAASGPLIRSSYRADEQARAAGVLPR
jgi:lipoic acid synthetase